MHCSGLPQIALSLLGPIAAKYVPRLISHADLSPGFEFEEFGDVDDDIIMGLPGGCQTPKNWEGLMGFNGGLMGFNGGLMGFNGI